MLKIKSTSAPTKNTRGYVSGGGGGVLELQARMRSADSLYLLNFPLQFGHSRLSPIFSNLEVRN